MQLLGVPEVLQGEYFILNDELLHKIQYNKYKNMVVEQRKKDDDIRYI